MVKGCLPDGSVVWVDATKVKPKAMPLHPPFSESKREILRQLKVDLDEVCPTAWKSGRNNCAVRVPDREMRIWRWVAYRFKHLTGAGHDSQARKEDYFQLLVKWTLNKDVDAVLSTVDLGELTRDDAKQLLQCLWATNSEFFGGRLAKWFPATPVIDLAAIHSFDELKRLVAPASVIFAVDWQSGDKLELVFGSEVLKSSLSSGQAPQLPTLIFAIDFCANQLERLLATVRDTKGWCE